MRTSGPGQSALLLIDVVDSLVAQSLDYAVIGAMAASVHGVVRASMDADVLLSTDSQKAEHLERIFDAAGLRTLNFDLMRRLAKRYGRDASESLERLLAG